MRIQSVPRRVRNAAARALLKWLGLLSRGKPVPLDVVAAIRILGIGEDPLVSRIRPVPAERAVNGPLTSHLQGRELGTWALGPRSLGFLQDVVSRERPRLAIEFGSGISTAVLALAMRDGGAGSDGPIVISFEQDEAEAARTQELLAEAGLAELVVVVVAPLARQRIEGSTTTCYVLPEDVDQVFGDRKADLVLVDGPAAEAGARFGTLPLAHPFVSPRALFVLDDALRDGELSVARRWRSLPYVRVDGIRIAEKGLLTGVILGP